MKTARMFKFLVLPGRERAYGDYLRDVVTPIDEAAHKADTFLELVTLTPNGESAWNHGRVFVFRDAAQRAAFDGSDEARIKRKAYAETLRRQIVVSGYDIS